MKGSYLYIIGKVYTNHKTVGEMHYEIKIKEKNHLFFST
jgi:hypothetical protein